ncbi:protein of unknown function [uncultured Woeseiaceae bacterium]|uniref:Uncharacterized protein n=1 Tax=uncultured Woeseiaceae bacterium TaxID=1983305 RepID=A0A7D9H3L5_9GAMM|nr:protein of unknown function [uncultured Woeseiaceae bacterium]
MKLLVPGTGNQKANKAKAVRFVVEKIIDAASSDEKSGEVVAKTGDIYTVSAYAETPAAFAKTPGVGKEKNSIYASGHQVLMVRQIKNDDRILVYKLDPEAVSPPTGSSSIPWQDISKASDCVWVCKGSEIKLIDKK